MLGVPLLRNGEPVGVFSLARHFVEPFTESQVKLVSSFADQAVLALGSARLFNELKIKTHDLEEALQQQTATAEVLRVISRSAFDLQAVLDTLTESASRLCDAESSHIYLVEGDVSRLAACCGFSIEYEELLRRTPLRSGRGTLVGRTLQEGRIVHLPDALADDEYRFFEAQKLGHFSNDAWNPDAAGWRHHGRAVAYALQSTAVYRKTDRTSADLCGPGSDCNRERPAVRGGAGQDPRSHRIPAAADRNGRGPQGHYSLNLQPANCLRYTCGIGNSTFAMHRMPLFFYQARMSIARRRDTALRPNITSTSDPIQ
jgi:hypothetical protein